MIFSLIAGLILGGLAVVFALQNVAVVTVSVLSWQLTGPLAFILLGTLVAGGAIALLVLLPSLIRDEMLFSVLKSEKANLEKEVVALKVQLHNLVTLSPAPSTTDTIS